MFRQFLLAAILTDRAIYGKKGIDIKFRLGLYQALKQKAISEPELKDVVLRALPLKLGERFSMAASIVAIVGGILFIGLASESVRDFVLRIHRVSDGPLDYVLLAVQWLGFYVGVSLLAFALTIVTTVGVYACRIWKCL